MTTSSVSLDDIETTNNLLKVLENYKPPVPRIPVIRVVYDEVTGNVITTTHDTETTEPHIIISQEEYDWLTTQMYLRVVNGKLESYDLNSEAPVLQLKEGTTWKTTEDNMLVMGNDTGWNDKSNS